MARKPVRVHLGPDRLVSLKIVDWRAEQEAKEEAESRSEDFAMEDRNV